MSKQATPIILAAEQHRTLEIWIEAPTTHSGLVQQGRIILMASKGMKTVAIAQDLGIRAATVSKWRTRFAYLISLYQKKEPIISTRLKGITCLAVCLLVAGLLASPTLAQAPDATISMSVNSIVETDAGFVVTGTVTTAGPVSDAYVNRYYTVDVLAEIMESDSAQYPKLPDALRMTTPDGAVTGLVPGSGPGGTLTSDELSGVDIAAVTLGRPAAPGTAEFSGTIPLAYAGKPCRIRATLDFQVMYSGAMYPAITYKHAEGFSGTVAGTTPATTTDTDDTDDSDDGNTDAEDRKDPDPPYDISGDLDIDTPKGDIMDDLLGDAGDAYTKPPSGTAEDEIFAFTPPSSLEGLEGLINVIQASLARDDLTDEERDKLTDQRNELVPKYHQALLEDMSMEQAKIWAGFYAIMAAHTADKLLTYHPHIGPFWSTAKTIVAAEMQKWDDMFLHGSTVPPVIPIGGGKWMGNPSQLLQDYLFIAKAFMPTYTGHRPDTIGGTYGNWGTPGTPGNPEPMDQSWGPNR